MRSPLLKLPPLALTALLAAFALPASAAAETVAPLPESDYGVRAACSAPPAGFASCQALELVPLTVEAKRHTHPLGMARPAGRARPSVPSPKTLELGLRPQDLHSVYSLPTSPSAEQTIAIVDAYNDPTAEADLKTYSEEFALPLCTEANGCFRQVSQSSGSPLPFPKTTAELETLEKSPTKSVREEGEEVAGWGVEISLDIETAHATCQTCHILLVEANDPSTENLTEAESRAEELEATVISNSWGAAEQAIEASSDQQAPFNDPGIVITTSAGDDGFRNWDAPNAFERNITNYPASSPHVVAVGGTRLALPGPGGAWRGETVWNGSGAGGGGCSVVFAAPAWQQQVANWSHMGCGTKRAVADVAADADPYTGVAIYDSDAPGKACATRYIEEEAEHVLQNWCTYGGTSLASPIVASTFALAGGAGGAARPAETLYANLRDAPESFHDVTAGSNGKCASFNEETGRSNCTQAEEAAASCGSTYACQAEPGYDGPTGVGTPDGLLGFVPASEETETEHSTEGAGTKKFPQITPIPVQTPAVTPPAPPEAHVTVFKLTAPALSALAGHRATAHSIVFTFVLSVASKVRVTLLRLVRSHHRSHWATVGRAATIAGVAGRNVKRFPGSARLSKGLYRLTIKPASGPERSMTFRVR